MIAKRIIIVSTFAVLCVFAACTKSSQEKSEQQPAVAQEQTETQVQDNEMSIHQSAVPAAVMQAFTKAYPKAKIKGASKETEHGETYYEIESVEGMKHRDVSYTPDGTVSTVEETIQVDEVPGPVITAVQKKYPDGTVRRMERVTKGSEIFYELLIESKSGNVEAVYGPDGKLLKEEKKGKDEE